MLIALKIGIQFIPYLYILLKHESSNMQVSSYLEKIIYEKIYELFDDTLIENIQVNQYYDWLKNPKTKKPLQLDFLISFKEKIIINERLHDVVLAVEIQGQQHYKEVKDFHRKKSDFKNQQIRDKIKFSICKSKGIPLIRIKYNKITWRMNLKQTILKQLLKIKSSNEFGHKNKNYLIEHISKLTKFNYKLTNIDKNVLFNLNEQVLFLKQND